MLSRTIAQMLRLFVAALLSTGVAGANAAAAGPTGDAATIAFYREVQASYNSIHTIVGGRHGYFSYAAAPYSTAGNAFTFRYGEAAPPGFKRASESLTYTLKDGRVTRFVDAAKAAGFPPLTIIQDSTGAWGRLTGPCYSKTLGAGNIGGIGFPFLGVFGDFQPMQRTDKVIVVRSRYHWGNLGREANEADRISATTRLMLSEQIRVGGPDPFTFTLAGLREPKRRQTTPSPTPRC